MWSASGAPPAVICASALWSSLVHPPSPFGLPVSQNAPLHAPPQLPADARPATPAAPADVADASGDRTVPDVRCSMIGSEVEQLPESGQLTLPDGHKPQPLHMAAPAANGAAAVVTKSGSFGIPETPSLGDELRGGFTLPQRLNSIQLQVQLHSRALKAGSSHQCARYVTSPM